MLIRLNWCKAENGGDVDCELSDLVELVVSAQTYGNNREKDAGNKQRRADLNYLLSVNQDCPISICYDFDSGKADAEDLEDISAFWQAQGFACGEDGSSFPFKHATLIRRWDRDQNRPVLTNVIPRRYPLRLGKGVYATQGKAANHLNSTRKLWGHCTQVLDANMDGILGEGFKVPLVTHQFLEHNTAFTAKTEASEGELSDAFDHSRKTVKRRIIGFREYIFTQPLGGVASTMASAEATFGTIFQRVLASPLGVRMHYGHPDFFDTFWVLNRGGLSKASPNINLSEDVFAGCNAWQRGEKVSHVDTLEWQKGRETVFTTASMFLAKISAGSVGMLRTRDMMNMNSGLALFQRLSLLCGGVGYFLAMKMLSVNIFLYASTFFLFSVAEVRPEAMDLFDSTLSVEWVLGFGLCCALPFLAEQILERGFIAGCWFWLKEYLRSTLFYLFQNQTVAHAVSRGMVTGQAAYLNTGRPSFFTPYTKELAYRLYVQSHYYPALTVVWLYSYRAARIGQLSATIVVVMFIVVLWFTAPVFFCPQNTDLRAVVNDWGKTAKFLISNDATDKSLFGYWKRKHAADNAVTQSISIRVSDLFVLVIQVVILYLLDSPGGFLDYIGFWILWAAFVVLTLMGRALRQGCGAFGPVVMLFRPLALLIWTLAPAVTLTVLVMYGLLEIYAENSVAQFFIGLPTYSDTAAFLIRLVLLMMFLQILLRLSLIIAAACLPKNKDAADKAKYDAKVKRYEAFVETVFLLSLSYHVHMYCAVAIFLVQFVTSLAVLLLGKIMFFLLELGQTCAFGCANPGRKAKARHVQYR